MKKWISGLLALVMVLSLAAFPAHAEEEWTGLTGDGGELSAGNYILNNDVTLTENITIKKGETVTIDLNGHTLTGASGSSVITVKGELTLADNSTEKTGTITGGNLTDGNGGGVNVSGKFTMTGGTISGNRAKKGAGVYVQGSGEFIMDGGIISNNDIIVENQGGGGVQVSSGTFTMNGGTISGNTAKDNGGGVSIISGTFTMNGGTISGNTAENKGGGVYIKSGGSFTMNGGTISGNEAKIDPGGGVYMDATTTFTMEGGTITGNTAGSTGGGIHFEDYSGATITGGSIYLNHAERTGGQDIAILAGTLNISGTVNSSIPNYTTDGWYEEKTQTTINMTTTTNAPLYLTAPVQDAAKFYTRTLTLDGSIGVNYYVDMKNLSDEEMAKYSVVFTVDGETQSRTANYVSNSYRNDFGDGETYYRFTVYLDSTQMAKTFTAELKYNNGTNVQTVQSDKYSVQTYCKRAIEGNWVEKDLCAALLNYGGYSQTYFGETDADKLANKNLSTLIIGWSDPVTDDSWDEVDISEYKAEASATMPSEIAGEEGSRFLATLRLESQTVIRIYFNIAGSYNTTDLTFTVGGKTLTIQPTASSDTGHPTYGYYVEFEVPASWLSTNYTVTIKGTISEVTGTVKYSALAYVNSMQDSSETTLVNVCKALYFYSAKADECTSWYTGNT